MQRVKRIFFSVIFSVSFFYLNAQSFGPVKDEPGVRKKLAEISQTTSSIKSDFVQEKNLSMLSEKIISKGTFYFEKENKVPA